jgi:diguanylate cyclase (GGDEF)-like protein
MFAFLRSSSTAVAGFTSSALAAPRTRKAEGSERLAGAVTGLAGLAALAIALAFPAAYLLSANNRLMGVVEVRAQIYGEQVTDIASQNPELWNAFFGDAKVDLTGLAIAAADDAQTAGHAPEHRRVFAGNGRLLLDVAPPQPLAWPTVSWRTQVLQNGNRLGDVEIIRSLRPELLNTLAIAIGSFTLGFLLLIALRVIPLRLMREALDRVAYLSAHDQLTGLPNRVVLAGRLEMALSAARRSGVQVATLCLDLDRFKEVNDTLGHPIGDLLLQAVAERMTSCVRGEDIVARLGGDEFAIVQVASEHPPNIIALAARLIDVVGAPYNLNGHQVVVGTSIGIAIAPADGDKPDILMKNADLALYRAKADGGGIYRFFEREMDARMEARRVLELDLRKAIVNGEFELYYQPITDVKSGQITGCEALIRWHHPTRGMVQPMEFISIAEETGLIVPLGEWVLRQACAEAARWPKHVTVAVNVSPAQFKSRNLVPTVVSALATSGLLPGRLELEITELTLMQENEGAIAILHQFRDLGVKVAMDDFGTGYSSLGYLRSFPFDKIKIDQSFIRDLPHKEDSVAIVRAVVGLSSSLGITTTAEGVETQEQLASLTKEGCNQFQGFLVSQPRSATEVAGMLTEQTPRVEAVA